MSNANREPDNPEPEPLAVNKETLQDLDVEDADAERLKGGVSGSGGVPLSRGKSYHPSVPTLLTTA